MLTFPRTLASPATFGRSPEPSADGILRQDLEDSGKLSGHRHPGKGSGNSAHARGKTLFHQSYFVMTFTFRDR